MASEMSVGLQMPWRCLGSRIQDADGDEILVATKAAPAKRLRASATAEATVRIVNAHSALYEALSLVQRGISSGALKDQSILPPITPDLTEITPVPLSKIINDALSKARGA